MSATAVCSLCNGTTWLEGVGGVTRCECWEAKVQKHAPGVPREFHDATLDNYRAMAGNASAVSIAKAFAESDRDLYLSGPVGCGKSRLAASLANDAHARKLHAFFARVPMLLLRLQPKEQEDARAEAEQLMHTLCTVPLLVLDDIGAERDASTDFTRRTLFMIYEERGDKGHRTIWTSNLRLARPQNTPPSQPTLAEFMGDDRLASRIVGRCDVVWINTSDQRVAIAVQRRASGDR